MSYSQLHGMVHAWHFLTGSLPQLKRVWKAYTVEAAIERGMITHTPALFVIDPQGRKAKVFITQQSYSAVGQLGKLLAQEASNLLPGHPPVHSSLSYAPIAGDRPERSCHAATLRRRDADARPGRIRAPVPVLRHLESRDDRPRGTTDVAEPVRVRGRGGRLAAVDGGRRGQRRAVSRSASGLPGNAPAATVLSGRDRPHRPGRGRVRGAGRAVVRARLSDRTDPLLPGGLNGRLAEPHDAGAVHASGAGARTAGAGRRGGRRAGAGRLPGTAGRPARSGEPAARRRARPAGEDPGAAWLPGRGQRVGVVVRAVPSGVRPVRRRLDPVRTARRVPRSEHQRLPRRRTIVPGPTPRQLPELPGEQHFLPELAGRDRGPPDDNLHQLELAK